MVARAAVLASTLYATVSGCGLVLDLGADDAGVERRRDGAASDARAGVDANAWFDSAVPLDAGSSHDATPVPADATLVPADSSAACGLYDDFEDGVAGPEWTVYRNPGVMIEETGGALVIQPDAGTAGASYAGYQTAEPLNLTNGWVEVRADGLTDPSSLSEMFFQITDGSWLMLFGYSRGRMVCRTEQASHEMRDATHPPYSASRDVYWRIRHEGASLVCETSPDRTTWIERARKPNYLDMSNVWFSPYAGTWQSEPEPGIARYDDARAWSPALCP